VIWYGKIGKWLFHTYGVGRSPTGLSRWSFRAGEFGDAYGLHAARFAAELIGYRTNIPRAWRRWSRGESIED
jgi:hypothetical protein